MFASEFGSTHAGDRSTQKNITSESDDEMFFFSGLTHVQMMRRITESPNPDDVIMKLRQIADFVLRRPHRSSMMSDVSRYAVHATSQSMSQAVTLLNNFIDGIEVADVDRTCRSKCSDTHFAIVPMF